MILGVIYPSSYSSICLSLSLSLSLYIYIYIYIHIYIHIYIYIYIFIQEYNLRVQHRPAGGGELGKDERPEHDYHCCYN